MLHLLSQSSRSESVLVGAQAGQTGRKHGDNGDQVPHQFFFWRERPPLMTVISVPRRWQNASNQS